MEIILNQANYFGCSITWVMLVNKELLNIVSQPIVGVPSVDSVLCLIFLIPSILLGAFPDRRKKFITARVRKEALHASIYVVTYVVWVLWCVMCASFDFSSLYSFQQRLPRQLL